MFNVLAARHILCSSDFGNISNNAFTEKLLLNFILVFHFNALKISKMSSAFWIFRVHFHIHLKYSLDNTHDKYPHYRQYLKNPFKEGFNK